MASKKTFGESEEYVEAPVEKIAPVTVAPSGPIPGTCLIENLCACEVDLHLTDGTSVPLGPKAGKNTATGIPKKLLPPYVRRLAAEGKIRITDLGR